MTFNNNLGYSASHMMKIRSYPIFAIVLGLIITTQTLIADAPTPWLDLVRQRLELEQANPDILVISKKYGPEEKKHALDHAVVLYHDRFEKFYKGVMPLIDPCREWCETKDSGSKNKNKQKLDDLKDSSTKDKAKLDGFKDSGSKDKDKRKLECKEWCDLKDYLDENKKKLDEEYTNLKQRYRGNFIRTDSEGNKIKTYENDVKHYYEEIIEVLKSTIIEGQNNEVKLFKESVKEKRQEMIKEKRSDEAAIMQDET